ncbi:MAG: pyridoxal phosphate-dependent aminotransferase, partial [Chrysiogenales bacterium]
MIAEGRYRMSIAGYIRESMTRSSWIRKMFEEGLKLKARYGEENVFDFSIGNPDLDPPEEFFKAMRKFSGEQVKGAHGYMPNAGFPDVREAIAARVAMEHGVEMHAGHVVMTCGAAGGLNTVLKTLLNPGEEVVVSRPYFMEYAFYVANHNGLLIPADTRPDFSLDMDAIRGAINEKTKAVLINSPNNPTGRVYPEEQIRELADILLEFRSRGQTIYLISDEPYREIIYDGVHVAIILAIYPHSIVVNSYSKSLSIPGERIGYIAVNPSCDGRDELLAGLVLCNRILGFVNAPALMQRIVAELSNVTVDITPYRERRELLAMGL